VAVQVNVDPAVLTINQGNIVTNWHEADRALARSDPNGDFDRGFTDKIENASSPIQSANGRINFAVELAAGVSWHTCNDYILKIDGGIDQNYDGSRRDLSSVSTLDRA